LTWKVANLYCCHDFREREGDMRGARLAGLSVRVLLAIAVAAAAWPVAANAVTGALSAICPVSGPIAESLSGVAETSPSDVWAVGSCFNGNEPQTLIEH
jgi:hypothetical protein